MRTGFLLVVGLIVIGCAKEPAPPTPIDATTFVLCDAGDECTCACTNLANIGCEEGTNARCVDACHRAHDTAAYDLKPGCLASAKDKTEARACGTVVCK